MAGLETRIQRVERLLRPDDPGAKETAQRRRITRRQAFTACEIDARGLTAKTVEQCFPKIHHWLQQSPVRAASGPPEDEISQLHALPCLLPLHGPPISEDAPL